MHAVFARPPTMISKRSGVRHVPICKTPVINLREWSTCSYSYLIASCKASLIDLLFG